MASVVGRADSGHNGQHLTARGNLRGAPPPYVCGGPHASGDWAHRSFPKVNVTLTWAMYGAEGMFRLKLPNGHQAACPGAYTVFDLFDLAYELKGRRDRGTAAPIPAAARRGGHWRWQSAGRHSQ